MRVHCYVDGFNFYYGLRDKGWRKFYWMDMAKMLSLFLDPGETIQSINYCTSTPFDNGQKTRQGKFLQANKVNPVFKTTAGNFLQESVPGCRCGKKMSKEKQTDVNLAVSMIEDVFYKRCDVTVLVSGDSDLAPALKLIRSIAPSHQVRCVFPPGRRSGELVRLSTRNYAMDSLESKLRDCLLADPTFGKDGYPIEKPKTWI